MSKKIELTINDQKVQADPGQTILEVVHGQELDTIPTLCHSEELEPYGSCFVCVVEVEGRPNLLPACSTRVAPDMVVNTRSDRVLASRKTALELLCSNHYADCTSPCMEGCPAGVDAQGYLALAAMGEYGKAVDLIRETNPLPAVCGRVCVRKCELECRRQDIESPVGINWVKRYLTDLPGVYDKDPEREPDRGKSVGIVGSGPAGLTAAWFLGKKGYSPVIYEANEKTGGMVRYGIPEYRLPDDVLDKEVDYIRRAGAEILTSTRVGEDITLAELRDKHDAVFLGPGAWGGKSMRVEGEWETEGVVQGADFLPEMARNPRKLEGTIVVVGGGNTAMDVARTAWRLEAEKVIIAYRRTKAQMPADEMEIEDALEEGVEIMELTQPVGIVTDDDNHITALKCIRMKLGEKDASGRRRPVPIEGSDFELPCDMAVAAIGQTPILDGLEDDLDVSRWKTYDIDTRTMKTNMEDVFAGGDAADDGPTVVIDAIRDGQRAAKAIHSYLSDEDLEPEPFAIHKEFWAKPGTQELGEIEESPRHEIHTIPVDDRRSSFREVATGFSPEDTEHETARCLSCGCVRFDDCELRLLAEEYGVDMEVFKGYARKHKVDDRHPYISYDPNKCILCSRCIRTCQRVLPISALGLVNRGFSAEMRPAMNDPLARTNCVACGNCVDACPTAALTIKYPFPGRAALATTDTSTHCAFCSLSCEQKVRKFGEQSYFIDSNDVPGDYLCRYGRFGVELFEQSTRITAPEVRRGSCRDVVDLPTAAAKMAQRLKQAADTHGPEKVGVFVSPELTTEEMYLAGRIAREGLGTSNVASLSIMATGQESGALDEPLGFTGSTEDRSCIAQADLIVCNNTALESDHLILAVDVIEAVRNGAKLLVTNSTLDPADQFLGTLALDPIRGRSTWLYSGVTDLLTDSEVLSTEGVPGAEEFNTERSFDLTTAAQMTGLDEEDFHEAAKLFADASNVVFIHGMDRPQDQAPGDMAALADLLILLRSAGKQAEILLPRLIANSAGVDVAGADPVFAAGRDTTAQKTKGATSRAQLRKLLDDGEIKAALIIGEDPMGQGRTARWFGDVEFLGAMDWTPTETTSYADIVLPGTTYLENAGTRVNFEGEVVTYAQAVTPPSGHTGTEVLRALASELGITTEDCLTEELENKVKASLPKELLPFLWNTGQKRKLDEQRLRLVKVDVSGKRTAIMPPLVHSTRYRAEIRQVGTERYRVH